MMAAPFLVSSDGDFLLFWAGSYGILKADFLARLWAFVCNYGGDCYEQAK